MPKPIISMIAIIGENRAIGINNKLLWDIPEDMKHFRKVTAGHPVIMGQKTYESIGRLLPDRTNIILSLNPNYKVKGAMVCHTINEAIKEASKVDQEEIFFIGGGQIYKLALPLADKLYLTVVKGEYEADTFFPDYSEFKNVISRRTSHDKNYQYTFLELER